MNLRNIMTLFLLMNSMALASNLEVDEEKEFSASVSQNKSNIIKLPSANVLEEKINSALFDKGYFLKITRLHLMLGNKEYSALEIDEKIESALQVFCQSVPFMRRLKDKTKSVLEKTILGTEQ